MSAPVEVTADEVLWGDYVGSGCTVIGKARHGRRVSLLVRGREGTKYHDEPSWRSYDADEPMEVWRD